MKILVIDGQGDSGNHPRNHIGNAEGEKRSEAGVWARVRFGTPNHDKGEKYGG